MINIPLHRRLVFKLFALIAAIIVAAIATNAWQNGRSTYNLLKLTLQEHALEGAKLIAVTADATLRAWRTQLTALTSGAGDARSPLVVRNALAADHDLILFQAFEVDGGGRLKPLEREVTPYASDERLLGKPLATIANLVSATTAQRLAHRDEALAPGALAVLNTSAELHLPILTLAMRFPASGDAQAIWGVLTIWQTPLLKALAAGEAKGAMILDAGDGVISAARAQDLWVKKAPETPLTVLARTNKQGAGFREWQDHGLRRIGAFARLNSAPLTVFTVSDAAAAYDAVHDVIERALTLSGLLLLVSLLISYAGAAGVTAGLRALMEATVRIADGDLATQVRVRSRDEVGLLGLAVNHMGQQITRLLSERVERARLEGEMRTAKLVQASFLRLKRVQEPSFLLTSYFQPATECSGDWWGHYQLSPTLHLVYVGDATGHGVPAALVTAMAFAAASLLSATLTESGRLTKMPGELLRDFNRVLASSENRNLSMTLLVSVIDVEAGCIHFANAGHLFPLLIRRGTDANRRRGLRARGAPLGLDRDAVFETKTEALQPGDRILFYTDGLTECANPAGEQFGKRRLDQALAGADAMKLEQISEHLVSEAFAHYAGHAPDDDITVVALEIGERLAKDAAPEAPTAALRPSA